jgi:mono/diheme cytochrome c family protein
LKILLFAFCLLPFAFAVAACRQDMHDQPKYEPFEKSQFFADDQSARQPVEGTVARGFLREDTLLYTGKVGDTEEFSEQFPFQITDADMDRGENYYNAYCAMCHSRTGNGDGMIVQRGYRQPPSFHIDRLRAAPPGYIFDVITNGFGAMPSYGAQIEVRDRWRIIAYLKALQLSQNATLAEVPAEERGKLEQGGQK